MKKILVIALAVVMMVSALALVACAPETKVAYGRVHKSYAGKGTLVISGGKIVEAYFDEACLPTQVTAPEAIEGYTVEATGKSGTVYYYKTVKFDGVTMEYDAEQGSYMVGTEKAADWLLDAANCEKYFEAAASNNVAVVLASGEDKTIMTAAKLLKSQNGYWPTTHSGVVNGTALGWKANVEATCAYVVANGFAAESFTDVAGEGALDNEKVDNLGVHTGATWTDMADYYNVLKAAYSK